MKTPGGRRRGYRKLRWPAGSVRRTIWIGEGLDRYLLDRARRENVGVGGAVALVVAEAAARDGWPEDLRPGFAAEEG